MIIFFSIFSSFAEEEKIEKIEKKMLYKSIQ